MIATLWGGQILAQQVVSSNDTDLSKEAENPVTRIIALPLRYEAEFDDGANEATKETFEIDQAVLPFRLSDEWAQITRTKLPYIVQPPKKLGHSWATGLGNGYTTFFLSPEHGEGFFWGVGPLLYYPATNSTVGVTNWGTGPSVAFLHRDEGPWVLGAVVNNIWSTGGPPTGSDRTNKFLLNPIASYHFAEGWGAKLIPRHCRQLDHKRREMDRPDRRWR